MDNPLSLYFFQFSSGKSHDSIGCHGDDDTAKGDDIHANKDMSELWQVDPTRDAMPMPQ